jgi:hypothetical protein
VIIELVTISKGLCHEVFVRGFKLDPGPICTTREAILHTFLSVLL